MSSTQSPASVLSPSGDLTIFEATDFRNSLVTLLSQEGPVTVDLSGVKHMDCSCLQVVLAARRSGRLTVTGLTEVGYRWLNSGVLVFSEDRSSRQTKPRSR